MTNQARLQEIAQHLDGSEYDRPFPVEDDTRALFKAAKEEGIVIVFGASDDLIEFRGAIDDEMGIGSVHLLEGRILLNACEEDRCPYFEKLVARATVIEGRFNGRPEPGEPAWTFHTDIPHQTFDMMDEGSFYCRGIVFARADIDRPRSETI